MTGESAYRGATCCWCGKPLQKDPQDGMWWCPSIPCQYRQAEHGILIQKTEGRRVVRERVYTPLPKQTLYHETRLTPGLIAEVQRDLGLPAHVRPRMNRLFGGAAGPGKSHALRHDMYRKAQLYPGFTGAILRRTMPELKKTHLRAFQRDAARVGAEFLKSENQLVWPNGSLIECGHCEDDDAVQKWLSAEYDQIGFDEGSTFEPDHILEISTRARTSNLAVQEAGGPWCDVVTNPGGRAWGVLKDLFVHHSPDYDLYPGLRGAYHPKLYVYIKALLDDNPYIDPGYVLSLAVLNDARYQQLRWGAEDVTEGAFFSEWRETREGQPWHVREVDTTGAQWFGSMDWGYNSPGVVLWWAILPDGHYHIAQEWKFRESTADEIATRVKELTHQLGIRSLLYLACDPAMRGRTGAGKGESIFETMLRRGLPMRAADNDRFNGWARVHQFLRESPQGRPWLTVAPGCVYGRRTMPAQVQDKHDPDDLDTNKDDHWADACRYGVASRPPTYTPGSEQSYTPPGYLSHRWFQERERRLRPKGVLA